jgi:hypothetical protein
MMAARIEVIESTAGQVAAELARRGIFSQERVTIMIDQEQGLIPGRRETRARVIAAGLLDDDIDRIVKQARTETDMTGQALIDALQASPHRDVEIEPPRSAMPVRGVAL